MFPHVCLCRRAQPQLTESGEELFDQNDSDTTEGSDTRDVIRKRQAIFDKAMYVAFQSFLYRYLISFCSGKAKDAKMDSKDERSNLDNNIEKGKKAEPNLKPLTKDTVYFEDFNQNPSVKNR